MDEPTSLVQRFPAHEQLLAKLDHKYECVVLSVLSSTSIRARVERGVQHLRRAATDADPKIPLILFLGRPTDTNKLITMVEKTKHVLQDEHQQSVWQYNQLTDMVVVPPTAKRAPKAKTSGHDIDENNDDEDDDNDAFEEYHPREKTQPPPPPKTQCTLSIFLSLVPVPELQSLPNTTLQTS